MGLYDLKEFLTFEDVADYLKDKGIYDFDLSFESDYIKLKEFITELYCRKQITPVFHFCGAVLEQTHRKGAMIGKEIPTWTNDYLIIDNDIFTRLTIAKQEQALADYFYELYNNKKTQEYAYFYKPRYDRFVRFMDLLYPRIDFDTLIDRQLSNEPLQTENDRLKAENMVLQAKIAELESQRTENNRLKAEIERLTAELNKKPTMPAKEQQGDSLLVLGAVMDCLDNEIIRHYSQSVLIGKIREKYPNTTGLSESTISKKISESKRYLQQHK